MHFYISSNIYFKKLRIIFRTVLKFSTKDIPVSKHAIRQNDVERTLFSRLQKAPHSALKYQITVYTAQLMTLFS